MSTPTPTPESTNRRYDRCPFSVIKTDWNNFTPRVGFAYRLTNKTVVRGGYGLFMAGTILNPFRNNLSNQFPFSINQTFPGQNNNPNRVSLQNPIPDGRLRVNQASQARGITREPSQAYLQSWNFTIERELFGGTAVEMDYRGSSVSRNQSNTKFEPMKPAPPVTNTVIDLLRHQVWPSRIRAVYCERSISNTRAKAKSRSSSTRSSASKR